MRDFKRLIVINDGDYNGWTSSTRTAFIISVEGNYLKVSGYSGRDMFPHEINTAFGRFLRLYEQEFGEKVALSERAYPYRFAHRTGVSGCQDTFIEVERVDGYPDRKFLMHQSCFGKCDGFSCWVYDFLDLCLVSGFLKDVDGFYFYDPEEDAKSGLEMKIIKPRLTHLEEGWIQPHEHTGKVVALRTVREEPKPSEEEVTGESEPEGDSLVVFEE